MTCPLCGTPYPCAHSRTSTAVVPAPETSSSPAVEAHTRAEREHWRQEVVSRVRQHRARRRRFNSNASLELDFPAEAALEIASGIGNAPLAEATQPVDELTPFAYEALRPPVVRPQPRKIIRFPRQAPAELEMELAEPAPETPRILDAPEAEQMELLPSFADIRLEEAPRENLLDHELDLPDEPASLGRRFASGLVDGAIVAVALGVFAASFTAMLSTLGEAGPQPRPALLCALASGAMIWVLFQYLFLAYGRRTPGMVVASLELLAFDGRKPSLLARCLRALASALSAVSLGLGFFWAMVDEHTLGWHDRISQTYLKSNSHHSAVSTQSM